METMDGAPPNSTKMFCYNDPCRDKWTQIMAEIYSYEQIYSASS